MNEPRRLRALLACPALLAAASCFSSPLVMVDRATALEQEASGSFDDVEKRLNRAGIEPRPVPLTPEQIGALGARPPPLVDGADLTEADRLDGLLVQHCVGEGGDGLLVDTRPSCKGAADAEEVQTVVERENRARRQLWRWMHEQRSDVSTDDLQRSWHQAHLRNVVCGGWLESADGTWQDKSC